MVIRTTLTKHTRKFWSWRSKNVRIPYNVSSAPVQSRAISNHCNASAQNRATLNQTSSSDETSSVWFVVWILGILGLSSVAVYDPFKGVNDKIEARRNLKREEMDAQIRREVEAEVQKLRSDMTKEIEAKIQREMELNQREQRANEAPVKAPVKVSWTKAIVRAFFLDY